MLACGTRQQRVKHITDEEEYIFLWRERTGMKMGGGGCREELEEDDYAE